MPWKSGCGGRLIAFEGGCRVTVDEAAETETSWSALAPSPPVHNCLPEGIFGPCLKLPLRPTTLAQLQIPAAGGGDGPGCRSAGRDRSKLVSEVAWATSPLSLELSRTLRLQGRFGFCVCCSLEMFRFRSGSRDERTHVLVVLH